MAILASSYQEDSSQNICVVREITGLQIAINGKKKQNLLQIYLQRMPFSFTVLAFKSRNWT